jgi:small conductance mechanosensitive channel
MVNHTARSLRRVDEVFSISYDDDIEKAIKVIGDVFAADERARDEPPVWINVVALASSSVDIRARAWCATTDWWELRCDMLKRVKQAFDREGITIPYPHQVEIHKEAARPAEPQSSRGVRQAEGEQS